MAPRGSRVRALPSPGTLTEGPGGRDTCARARRTQSAVAVFPAPLTGGAGNLDSAFPSPYVGRDKQGGR
jgi:hypothetical protein